MHEKTQNQNKMLAPKWMEERIGLSSVSLSYADVLWIVHFKLMGNSQSTQTISLVLQKLARNDWIRKQMHKWKGCACIEALPFMHWGIEIRFAFERESVVALSSLNEQTKCQNTASANLSESWLRIGRFTSFRSRWLSSSQHFTALATRKVWLTSVQVWLKLTIAH